MESGESMLAMEEFKRDSDSVREFLEDNYEVSDSGEETSLRQIFDHYRVWYKWNVQESGVIKFRKNEMGKRIKDIMGVEPCGRKYFTNADTGHSDKETMYPIKLKDNPLEAEVEMTPEQAKQANIDF